MPTSVPPKCTFPPPFPSTKPRRPQPRNLPMTKTSPKKTSLALQSSPVATASSNRELMLIEYLSHGYTLTDHALQKAIDYDHTHGISKRFYGLLTSTLQKAQGVDQKFGVTQRAVAVDEKYGIQDRAKQTASGFMRYFENALDTPTGKRVRSFYDDRRKEILDIHAEARRYCPLRLALHHPFPGLLGWRLIVGWLMKGRLFSRVLVQVFRPKHPLQPPQLVKRWLTHKVILVILVTGLNNPFHFMVM